MSKWDWDSEVNELELGYESIACGKYLFQIEEGIKLSEGQDSSGEKTGSVQIMIPFQAVETKDDSLKDQVGKKISMFQNLIKKDGNANVMGERMVINVLKLAGVGGYMSGKIDDSDFIASDKVMNEICKCLPGRLVIADIEMGKGANGTPRPEIKRFKSYPKQPAYKAGPGAAIGAGKSAPVKTSASNAHDDEWA